MRERMKVPVPRPISSPSASISRASATNTRRRPLIQRPSATTWPVADRPGEVQVERGGQQEAVGDQRVGGIERRVVEHLEVDRAVRRAGRVVAALVDLEARSATRPSPVIVEPRIEQRVDRRRGVEPFERAPVQRAPPAGRRAAASGGVAVDDIGQQAVERLVAGRLAQRRVHRARRASCREIAASAWRCAAPPCSGESRPNTRSTGMPSAASKSTGASQPEERRDRPAQPGDARMRDRHAAAEAGAAQPLALLDPLEHRRRASSP